jgi:hypothetical protein
MKSKGQLTPVNPENVWESIESGSEQHSVEISIKAIWFQDDRIFIRTASGEERSMPLEWFQGFTMPPRRSASDLSFHPLAFIGRICTKI